jgi:hypothetical protein
MVLYALGDDDQEEVDLTHSMPESGDEGDEPAEDEMQVRKNPIFLMSCCLSSSVPLVWLHRLG